MKKCRDSATGKLVPFLHPLTSILLFSEIDYSKYIHEYKAHTKDYSQHDYECHYNEWFCACHQTWSIRGDCVCVIALGIVDDAFILIFPRSLCDILHNQEVVITYTEAVCDNLSCFEVFITFCDDFFIKHPHHLHWRGARCTARDTI